MSRILQNLSKLPISFGGAAISGEGGGYGFGAISEDMSIELLNYAFEAGVRIFDTAPIYGFTLSEKRIGKAFRNNREEAFLISKCGVGWHESKRVNMSNDPKLCKKMLEQSLKDLQSDYIDLYMIHWPDKNIDIRTTMEMLAKAKLEGKIKHIGLCNTYENDLNKALEIDKIEVVQSQLNIFEREVLNKDLENYKEKDISFMSWGTLDKGIIAGRVDGKRKFQDRSDCRSWAPWWKKSNKDFKIVKMQKLIPFLEDKGHSGLELALAHNLQYEGVDSIICGAKSIEQFDGLIRALDNLPSQELINKCLEMINES
jgi:aryl-alcohol dehydrogenase-like predicted oxidoreductase